MHIFVDFCWTLLLMAKLWLQLLNKYSFNKNAHDIFLYFINKNKVNPWICLLSVNKVNDFFLNWVVISKYRKPIFSIICINHNVRAKCTTHLSLTCIMSILFITSSLDHQQNNKLRPELYTAFANFHDVKILTMANFKQRM